MKSFAGMIIKDAEFVYDGKTFVSFFLCGVDGDSNHIIDASIKVEDLKDWFCPEDCEKILKLEIKEGMTVRLFCKLGKWTNNEYENNGDVIPSIIRNAEGEIENIHFEE